MEIKCSKCGQNYEVGPEYAGKSVECQCGETMTVPELPSESLSDVPAKKKKSFWGKEPEYLPGFRVPLEARVLHVLKFLLIIPVVIAFIVFILMASSGEREAGIASLSGVIMLAGSLSLSIAEKTFIYLAEIAFNTRLIGKK